MSDAATIDEPTTATAPLIHAAIIEIMRAVGPIAKSQRNEQQSYNYRGIDAVYNAVHPYFAQHGVYSTSTVLKAEHRDGKSEKGKQLLHAILTMRFTFWAADGSSVCTEVVGEGIDYAGDKASNKAMSVADKYAILQLLKIPTAAVDADKPVYDTPAMRTDAPRAAPRGERDNPENRPVSRAELEKLFAAWRSLNENRDDWPADEGKQRERLMDWVFRATGKSSLTKLSQWTRSDLSLCFVEIDRMEGTP